MICRTCIPKTDGCCKFPFHDGFKLILLPSEVARAAARLGKAPEEFIDTSPLSPYEREWFVTGPDRQDKLWARLFELWQQPTGVTGSVCPFVTDSGCALPYTEKPFICQAYPLDFNITTGALYQPTDTDCMLCEQAKSVDEILTVFNDNWESLQQRFKAYRRECLALLNSLEGLKLRACAPADKPTIMEFMRRTPEFLPVEVSVAEEVLDLYLTGGAGSGYHADVAELGGRVRGWVCYGPTPMTESTWDVYWMGVDPEVKGRGIGSALLALAEDRIRGAGGRLAVIETASKPSYDGTRAFYASRGWKPACRIPDYYATGDDLVVYTKLVS